MYNTVFRTLRLSYSGVQRLRVVIYILNKPCTPRAGSVPEHLEEAWFRPWQDLATSRTWEKLEIGIQASWFKDFSEGSERWAKRVGRQDARYTLVRSDDLDDLKRKGKRELLKYKLKGVEWLRTCRLG